MTALDDVYFNFGEQVMTGRSIDALKNSSSTVSAKVMASRTFRPGIRLPGRRPDPVPADRPQGQQQHTHRHRLQSARCGPEEPPMSISRMDITADPSSSFP